MKILLTGGGTAGHIYPIVAVIEQIKKRQIDYLYVGSNGLEKTIAHSNRLNFQSLPVGKWRGYFDFRNFLDLFKTFFGLIKAYFIIKKFCPDIVFAKGGFVTFPVLFWVKKMRIPLIIHESDSIPGRANQWAGSFAKKICVGFPVTVYKDFFNEKLVYTGIPLREAFLNKETKTGARQAILITGGSLGSRKINEELLKIMPILTQKYEIYHQLGEQNLLQSEFANEHYHTFGFADNLAEIMSKADLVISRSGATTLSEIAILAKPAILIPYPYAAHDHQKANAKIFSESNAAIVVEEKELSENILLEKINRIMTDSQTRKTLVENVRKFAKPQAAREILEIILNTNG